MASIIKVDQIQTAAGGTPTAADLGLNTTGTVLQVVSNRPTSIQSLNTSSTSYTDIPGMAVTITPTSTSSSIFIIFDMHIYVAESPGKTWKYLNKEATRQLT